MKSIGPKEYAALPQLDPPAGYICVVRDIDSDLYRIDTTLYPSQFIGSLLYNRSRQFGFELVSILETDDLAAAEIDLQERYHARLSSDWLELDPYQLEELRRSTLQIDAFASHYLAPQQPPRLDQATPANPMSRRDSLANSYNHRPSQKEQKIRRPRLRLPDRRYGIRSLQRNRIDQNHTVENLKERTSLNDKAAELFEDAFVNHPGIAIVVILLLMLISLFFLLQSPYNHL